MLLNYVDVLNPAPEMYLWKTKFRNLSQVFLAVGASLDAMDESVHGKNS